MFRLENVSFYSILDSINMEFSEEKVTCITGKSGGGKSTILKFLNKMLIPTEGRIFYKERPLESIDSVELRRQAVMLQQDPVLFDGSIEENLQIGLKLSKRAPAPPERLKEALQIVLLEKALSDSSEKLSGGEKQRLALARVLLMNPSVYLLDEPTSALDRGTEVAVMERVIQSVKERNGTVIMVTHSEPIADRFGEDKIHLQYRKKAGEHNE
ncbi:ATP-binding cassette domain-containing protein [Rossellomorea vietnamensis]|uniref:ATP-binding cassette domain-containing protein n=1 Tax=Rossellomorea vietnamensis TaxID=218284 RepID=A0A5D4NNQ2_9BACI|nr:ATP-binding cassette domain-containing protein [Rossellomorea vietnamensis]TYS15757.1 ATP-binding cassette domain-containing protein [Rossellomorea vietnamensis]